MNEHVMFRITIQSLIAIPSQSRDPIKDTTQLLESHQPRWITMFSRFGTREDAANWLENARKLNPQSQIRALVRYEDTIE